MLGSLPVSTHLPNIHQPNSFIPCTLYQSILLNLNESRALCAALILRIILLLQLCVSSALSPPGTAPSLLDTMAESSLPQKLEKLFTVTSAELTASPRGSAAAGRLPGKVPGKVTGRKGARKGARKCPHPVRAVPGTQPVTLNPHQGSGRVKTQQVCCDICTWTPKPQCGSTLVSPHAVPP